MGESVVYVNVSSSDPWPLTITTRSSLSNVTAASADAMNRYGTMRYRNMVPISIFKLFICRICHSMKASSVQTSKVELFITGSRSIPAKAYAFLHIIRTEGMPGLWRRCVHGKGSVKGLFY